METYCPHCAASHTYTLEKPTTCRKCGKAFAAAFKVATPVSEPRQEYRPEPVRQSFANPTIRPKPSKYGGNGGAVSKYSHSSPEDEYVDPYQKEAAKNDILSAFAAWEANLGPAPKSSVTLNELISNPDIVNTFSNPIQKVSEDKDVSGGE